MKLLIVFSLVAVAFAEQVRVVPLPPSPLYTEPSMGQVIIPNYIIDAIKVGLPVMRDAAIGADDVGFKVRFVDAPLEAEQVVPEPITLGEAPLPAFETNENAPEVVNFVDSAFYVAPIAEEEIIPDAVRFVDSPLDVDNVNKAPEVVAPVAEEEIIPDAVRFVDSPLDVDNVNEAPEVVAPVAEEEIIPDAVRFVDSPLDVDNVNEAPEVVAPVAEEEIIPVAVKFVDSPVEVSPVEGVRIAEPYLPEVVAPVAEEIVPEPVLIAEAPLPAFEAYDVDAKRFDDALNVQPVKVAVPQYNDYRGKQFDDPMLR